MGCRIRKCAMLCEPLERRMLLAGFSGTVFHDHEGSGTMDAGDEPLANVRVFIDRNNDGAWQSASEESDLSDATGAWSITLLSLSVGTTYHLRQVVPSGYVVSAPAGGVHDYLARFPTSTATGLDFGDIHPASASGVLWEDLNGNGLRDGGEPGVANHQAVVTCDATGESFLSSPSAADGSFTISGIVPRPGYFTFGQVIPAGWVNTGVAYGALNVREGYALSESFGSSRYGSVSGRLYEDANGNRVQDPGESPPPGATVVLHDSKGDRTLTVDASGNYRVDQLPPGYYSVDWNRSAPYFLNPFFQFPSGQLLSGQNLTLSDLTVARFATLTGNVWNDHDGDGIRDAIDGPAAGVKVYVDANNDGSLGTTMYAYGNAGKATITVGGVPGRIADLDVVVNGAAADATKTLTLTGPNAASSTLISGIKGTLNNLRLDDEGAQPLSGGSDPFTGSFRPVTPLSVFNGINPTGDWTLPIDGPANGHVTVQNWTLYLTMEEPSAVTDSNGQYTILYSTPGTFPLRIVPPPDWRQTSPASAVMATTRSGQTTTAPELGATQRTVASGRVFNDLNGDGVQNAGEPGLPSVTVFDDLNDDGVVNVATVNPAAADVPKPLNDNAKTTSSIQLSGLLGRVEDVNVHVNINHPFDSDLDVYLISPAGTRVELFTDVGGDGDNFTNTILDDQAAASIASASAPFTGTFRPEGALADFNHEDPNGAWTLEVTDDTAGFSGTLVSWSMDLQYGEPRATTDAAGNYQFEPLPSSRYILRQILPAGMMQTKPADPFYDVTLAPGVVRGGLDFGDHDIVAPQILSANFPFTVKPHRLDVQFSEDVSGSLAASDLVLMNRTTNATIATSSLTFSYGPNNIASWTYTQNGGILDDGDYRATIAAAGVTDASGNPLVADFKFDFFVLAGDANRDRSVGFADLVVLAQNYNGTGKTFAQGDFNYDGNVDFGDLVILAQHYNVTLPNQPPDPVPGAVAAVFSTQPIVARPVPKPVAKPADKHQQRARWPH